MSVVVDVELLEEGLVEELADVIGSRLVGSLAVARQLERSLEVDLDQGLLVL
ncbi:MAG: hypothetical protein ABSB96_05145 [Gaiellaceae bacterium]